MSEFEFTDRYKALGIPYPDSATVCQGQCEGTGFVPIYRPVPGCTVVLAPVERDQDAKFTPLWLIAHEQDHAEPCDGWHFVCCPECEGTGRRDAGRREGT